MTAAIHSGNYNCNSREAWYGTATLQTSKKKYWEWFVLPVHWKQKIT